MLLQKLKSRYVAMNGRSRWLLAAVTGMGATMLILLGSGGRPETTGMKSTPEQTAVPVKAEQAQPGYFLSDDIDQKAYVKRLEVQYFSLQDKNQALMLRFDEVADKLSQVMQLQAQLSLRLEDVDRRMKEALPSAVDAGIYGQTDIRKYQLDVININPLQMADEGAVYLPAGSFVSATLLTGVYAPAESSNPLPVLIRLDEAFYGPNETRIPLSGAFAIGKAVGDLNSERALVQISTLSCVLPEGEAFEHKGNIGYLTDNAGQLGIKGIVVRNTGGQLAMSFMTGFMGGASQALSDSQTTTVTTEAGHMARNVTGSRTKNAAFQGLAQSAGQMSKYYQDQLDKVVPAIKVDAGARVYLVVLEGVVIHGLKKNNVDPAGFID
ncbi:MAG: TraB/VirB10 family protein [Candidatus Omnitrophica bacterium]|nr:TraB/VirB10 family protein [Candidatus Omnitrophota bacterium]